MAKRSTPDDVSHYPPEVQSRTQPPFTRYTLLADHYAVHRQGADLPPANDAILTLSGEETTIDVFRGAATQRADAATGSVLGPVYAQQPGNTPVVPTGQIFLRFKAGVRATEYQREIEQAGYEIAQEIVYAPEAAWLRARSGRLSEALTGIAALAAIPAVENVEPQMLMPRASR